MLARRIVGIVQAKQPVRAKPRRSLRLHVNAGCARASDPAIPTDSDEEPSEDAVVQPTDTAAAPFSALELRVIGIGERDPVVWFNPGGRLARLRRLLFGIEAPTPFADRRLEALRLLAGALRGDRRSDSRIADALEAGITPRQIDYLKARA